MKPSKERIETRITSCKLDITSGLLILEDLLENEESTEEKQFKAQKVVEKLEKKLEVLMKLKNLALEKGWNFQKNQGKRLGSKVEFPATYLHSERVRKLKILWNLLNNLRGFAGQ